MTIFTEILIGLCILYVVLSIIMSIGLLRTRRGNNAWEPEVTIVIPARDEELNISRCLDSVTALDYPAEKMQVIVIDDHSTDRTAETAGAYSQKIRNFSLIRMVNTAKTPGGGKQAALAEACRHAKSEVILQTDADCVVPPAWIRTMLRQFGDNTGIVGGITVLDEFSTGNSCFTQIQSLDFVYLLSVGVGSHGVGIPLSCIGNNLAVRRTAYDAVGGYDGIPFSITEDFALFQAIVKSGWKSSFAIDKNALITSAPPDSVRTFIRQRLRWSAGGIRLAGPGVILLAAAFLFHLALAAGIPLGVPFNTWITALLLTAAGDLQFLAIALHKIRTLSLVRYFPLFELYYILYTTVFGIMLPFISGVSWKGRSVST